MGKNGLLIMKENQLRKRFAVATEGLVGDELNKLKLRSDLTPIQDDRVRMFLEGMSIVEIATSLNISRSAVESALNSAQNKMVIARREGQ